MSASIPIPGTRQDDVDDNHTPLMYEYKPNIGGMSLPVGNHFPSNPPNQTSSPFGSRDDIPVSSRDDIATSWPPRPSVRLVSRSARRWANDHRNAGSSGNTRSSNFEPWDFSEVANATDQVQSAFLRGSARAERPPREGVSGTYFIRRVESKNSVLGVFKPVDEEAGEIERSPTILPPLSHSAGYGVNPFSLGPHQGMSNSPSDCSPVASPLAIANFNNYSSRVKDETPGFNVGEGAFKEVAAYLLDHDHFARVPQTALATCQFESDLPEKNKTVPLGSTPSSQSSTSPSHVVDPFFHNDNINPTSNMRTKTGAFQVYVSNVGDADDFGPGVFAKDQVHAVAILDIRTLNCDRHSGNILVTPKTKSSDKGSRYDIVPIDHGYILPAAVKNIPWPIWMDWSMIREPVSPETKDYIARLDAMSEARILNDELEGKIRKESLRSLKIATTLLKKAVAAGLTLYEIGLLIYTPRQCPEARSELQKIVEEAIDAGYARSHHLENETVSTSNRETIVNVDRLPYRSSGNLPSQLPERSDGEDNHIEDFIVKYATKKISEIVRKVADAKSSRVSMGIGSGPFRLGRVRSIPDFGIGTRPISAMFAQPPADGSAPTPASSPVGSYGRTRRKPSDVMAAEGGTTPFHFSIESGLSIPIPNSKSSTMHPRVTPSGNFEQPPVPSSGKSKPRTKTRPRHRRNASERNALDKVGSLEDHVLSSTPPLLDLEKTAEKGSVPVKRNLPPLFKQQARKASPVGPLDLSFWADDTGDSRK